MEKTVSPNILLICADMIGARNFGCYGDCARVTPNVDSLAERGVLFEQAYCACPPCIPTRVSMMTGQYAHTHGKTAHVQMELAPRPPLIPEILSRHGYRTALVGKTHWWPPDDSLGCDLAYPTIDNHLTPELGNNDAHIQFLRERNIFDYHEETWQEDRHLLAPDNLPSDCLKVNWTGDKVCSVLEELAGEGGPFFLFCSFVEPHGPGSVQKEHLRRLGDIPLPPIITRENEHENKPEVQRRIVEHYRKMYAGRDLDEIRRGVYASLNLVDANVGKMLERIDRLGFGRNTVIVFLTDHGDLMFDHSLIEKTFLYESAIRIPFIVAGPGIPLGQKRRHLVSQIDLLPTILEFCGIEEEDLPVEGRSIVPLLADEVSPWREILYCEVDQTVHLKEPVASSIAKMLRTGPWKYIYTLVDGHTVEEELYNLDSDPDELYNLAHDAEQCERIAEFRSEILRWLVATQVNRLRPVPQNHYRVPRIERSLF